MSVSNVGQSAQQVSALAIQAPVKKNVSQEEAATDPVDNAESSGANPDGSVSVDA